MRLPATDRKHCTDRSVLVFRSAFDCYRCSRIKNTAIKAYQACKIGCYVHFVGKRYLTGVWIEPDISIVATKVCYHCTTLPCPWFTFSVRHCCGSNHVPVHFGHRFWHVSHCVACVNSMFIILQSRNRNPPCIVLLILPENDVIEYLN